MTVNNPNLLDPVNINAHTKFDQILSTRSQDIEQKQNSDMTSVKGNNSITKVQKMICKNPNLDLVSIKFNAYTKLSEILSICSQDIEWK